ncbi:glycosyltransferase [Aerococcus urinaeequi]|uniref:glycosyltransferase n=1 Tax=Aerococcus urinaeequi TaxID=51665 RepID=UPI003D6B7ECA
MQQKKMLYFSPINSKTISVGIWKKIQMQIEFFRDKGYEVKLMDTTYSNDTLFRKIIKRLPMQSINDWNFNIEEIISTDIIYIRYSKSDYGFLSFLKNVKTVNKDLKILLEIPTYPYDREEKMTVINSTLLLRDKYYRQKLKKYCDRILTYSNDDEIWGIKTIKLSNTINFDQITPINNNFEFDKNEINMIGVATLSFWHGYDRLIRGLYNYYIQDGDRAIKFHIVGDGPAFQEYKDIIKDLNIENYVKMYGRLEGSALSRVFDKSSIGVDALGRHRSGVDFNSSLKGKEYGAKGLPIISAVRTELDYYPSFKYYLKLDSTEDPIDVNEVVRFHDNIYKNKARNDVVKEIRAFNEDKFDIEKNWKKVIDYMNLEN